MTRNWVKPVLAVDCYCDAGLRNRMEDTVCMLPDLLQYDPYYDKDVHAQNPKDHSKLSYFAVFDGHGGDAGSRFLQKKFHHYLARHPSIERDITQAVNETYAFADHEFLRSSHCVNDTVGSTAVVALMCDNNIHVSWVGDSDAVLFYNRSNRRMRYKLLTNAHRPLRPDEQRRIEDNRGYVSCITRYHKKQNVSGSGRVNGLLAVSRSIGDQKLKEWVISTPEITSLKLDKTLSFMVLGSDGLWDVLTPEQVYTEVINYIKYRNQHLYPEPSLLVKGVASHLVKKAIRDNSMDNASAVVIFFRSADCFSCREEDSYDYFDWSSVVDIDSCSKLLKSDDIIDTRKHISTRKRISQAAKSASRSLRKVLIRGLLQV